jgi:putative transposase
MSRQVRQLSTTGFYHVVLRGINRQHLFEEESDFTYFLNGLQQIKDEMVFELHAYCLMSNHVHMLLRENQMGDISLIMKRLLTKYVMYFNRKYQRNGALIASRYKSIPVEVDEYFIPLLRYIHQNPVKAGMVEKMEDYKYSSYKEYLNNRILADTAFSLTIKNLIGGREPYEVASWPRSERNDVIRRLKEDGLSIRQIERATGISRGIIAKG